MPFSFLLGASDLLLFLQIIASKSTGQNPPVLQLEKTTFVYIRHKNLFLVAATRGNPNVAMIFEYLFQKLRIFKAYLGKKFTDESLHANFTLIYELFDETMDYGYPQNCSVDVLKLYINQGEQRENLAAGQTGATLTSQITGAIDWRREGIRYRNNQVFIDVQETISMMMSITGQVLRADINGRVMLKVRYFSSLPCPDLPCHVLPSRAFPLPRPVPPFHAEFFQMAATARSL